MSSRLLSLLFGIACAPTVLPAQDAPPVPALHEAPAAEYRDSDEKLRLVQERVSASLDPAGKGAFDDAQQKWVAYRDASVEVSLLLISPRPEHRELIRFLELNKLTRDRIAALERIDSAKDAGL